MALVRLGEILCRFCNDSWPFRLQPALKGKGWMRHDIVKPDGTVVNEFTFYVWGQICDVDLKGIRQAQRN
jgi:hypothetical protein